MRCDSSRARRRTGHAIRWGFWPSTHRHTPPGSCTSVLSRAASCLTYVWLPRRAGNQRQKAPLSLLLDDHRIHDPCRWHSLTAQHNTEKKQIKAEILTGQITHPLSAPMSASTPPDPRSGAATIEPHVRDDGIVAWVQRQDERQPSPLILSVTAFVFSWLFSPSFIRLADSSRVFAQLVAIPAIHVKSQNYPTKITTSFPLHYSGFDG